MIGKWLLLPVYLLIHHHSPAPVYLRDNSSFSIHPYPIHCAISLPFPPPQFCLTRSLPILPTSPFVWFPVPSCICCPSNSHLILGFVHTRDLREGERVEEGVTSGGLGPWMKACSSGGLRVYPLSYEHR
ncbi:uncharacterized protein LACBIDRAFT_301234 [Laccaria bicolor S238N-H82]|uniref:Predicted protein n=1 Tax=Laccaria bicolor (strain S238N-H82 / ATCC MYA-4686) TaxID=486041 RepID=B0CRP2_LACBS|nr:uncharacterized protein LACBIDRAFT_301234 [Laccaria bicolor S238N-H82]EDR15857.1 predicted protein [Laccaria bicolor S238N-H82]|eukprot:XP_001874065.1 predicted protein [Laccaria bicolor S238N-H82]